MKDCILENLRKFVEYEDTSNNAKNEANKLIEVINKKDMRKKKNKKKIFDKINEMSIQNNCKYCDTLEGLSVDIIKKWKF